MAAKADDITSSGNLIYYVMPKTVYLITIYLCQMLTIGTYRYCLHEVVDILNRDLLKLLDIDTMYCYSFCVIVLIVSCCIPCKHILVMTGTFT